MKRIYHGEAEFHGVNEIIAVTGESRDEVETKLYGRSNRPKPGTVRIYYEEKVDDPS